jgi:hypothetical protein
MIENPGSASRAPTEYDARASLRIPTFLFTILGLLTLGVFWGIYFAYWSSRHQKALSSVPSIVGVPTSRRSIVLGIIQCAVLLLAFALYYVPVDEGYSLFLCGLSLALLAVTWGSVIFEVRRAMTIVGPYHVDSLLLTGSDGRVIIAVIFNFVLAWGLLPLLIFPPSVASAINKYVQACKGDLQVRVNPLCPECGRMNPSKATRCDVCGCELQVIDA